MRFRVEKSVSFADLGDPLAASHSASLSSAHSSLSAVKTPPESLPMGFSWRFLLCSPCAPAVRVQCRCSAPHFPECGLEPVRPWARLAFMGASLKALHHGEDHHEEQVADGGPRHRRPNAIRVSTRSAAWFGARLGAKPCLGRRSSDFIGDDTAARADHAKWKSGARKMRLTRKSKLSPFSLLHEIAGIGTGYCVKIEAR